MIPGMNPHKMQQMMQQLGIKQEDIGAIEVLIKTKDKDLRIRNPSVLKVNMMGQETFQVSGEIEEVARSVTISQEDIKTVMDQAGVSSEKAKKALMDTQGDLAQAILSLSQSDE